MPKNLSLQNDVPKLRFLDLQFEILNLKPKDWQIKISLDFLHISKI